MKLPWSREEPPEEIVTDIECSSCSHKETCEHKDGDAVLGSRACPKCGKDAQIKMIYSRPPMRS